MRLTYLLFGGCVLALGILAINEWRRYRWLHQTPARIYKAGH